MIKRGIVRRRFDNGAAAGMDPGREARDI